MLGEMLLIDCPICGPRPDLNLLTVMGTPPRMRQMLQCELCHTVYNSSAFASLAERSQEELQIVDYVGQFLTSGAKVYQGLKDNARLFRGLRSVFGVETSGSIAIDFGCGFGLAALYMTRMFEKVYAVDFTVDGVEYLRQRFPKRAESILSTAQIPPVKADFIFAWHVFEHLSSPLDVLGSLLDCLAPHGVLLGQVPLLRDPYVIDEHFCFFNERSVRSIVGRCGRYSLDFNVDERNSFLTFKVQHETG